MTAGSKQQSKRSHEVISKRRQSVSADVAVGGTQHVDQVASAGAEALPHTEVVFEDLDGSRRNMLRAFKKIRGDVECEWIETFVCVATSLHFCRQRSVEKFFCEMETEQEHSFAVGSCGTVEQCTPIQIVA